MIAARIKAWQDSKLGRMSMTLPRVAQRQAAGGGGVNFVPEKFFGDNSGRPRARPTRTAWRC